MDGFIAVFLGLLVYIVPGVIALSRRHPWAWPIVALNIFAGWTALGWLAALIWSLGPIRTGDATAERKSASLDAPDFVIAPCPECAERISSAYLVCPHCETKLGAGWQADTPVVHLVEAKED